jgi:hypothetical protein
MNITTRQYSAFFLFALLIPGLGICAAKDSKEFIDTTSSCGVGVVKPWNTESKSESQQLEDIKKVVDYRVCLNSNGKFQNLESFIEFSNSIHEKIEKFENSKNELKEEIDTKNKDQINKIIYSEMLFIIKCFKSIDITNKKNILPSTSSDDNITILGDLLKLNQVNNYIIPICINLINNIDQSYIKKILNLYKIYCKDYLLLPISNNKYNNINVENNLDFLNSLFIKYNNDTILQNINIINNSTSGACPPGTHWFGPPSNMCI